MTIRPLTLGMLASALMRSDHGLFAPWFPDDPFQPHPPAERIPKAIDRVIGMYDRHAAGLEAESVTERQVREEFDGEIGFHRPEHEEGYAVAFDAYGLRELAIERIGARGDAGRG